RQVLADQAPAARDERLRHELTTERSHRVLAGMRADEQVIGETVEVECRQQFREVRRGVRLTAGWHGLSSGAGWVGFPDSSSVRHTDRIVVELDVILPDPVDMDQVG